MKNTSPHATGIFPSSFMVGLPALLAVVAGLLPFHATYATNLYWGAGGTSNSWATAANWYTDAGETSVSGAAPTSAEDVFFNTTGDNALGTTTTATVAGTIAANSITFNNTNSTFVQSTNTTARILNIGSGGVTLNSGGGLAQFGQSGNTISVRFAANQSWTNNSTNTLTMRNNGASADGAGAVALTLNAANSGSISNQGSFSDGTGSTLQLIVDSAGTGNVSMGGSSYSGGTIVKRGLLSSGGQIGTGTVLLGDTSGSNDARINLTGVATANIIVQANAGSGLTALTGSGSGDFQGTITMNRDLSIGSVAASTATISFSGAISGAGNLTIGRVATGTSSPTVMVSGTSNSYTGKTTIASATVIVSKLSNAGVNSSLGAATGAAGTITMSSVAVSTLRYTGTGDTTDRSIELVNNLGVTLEQAGTNALVFTGNVLNSGTGSRTLTLQGSTAGTGEISGILDNTVSNLSVTKAGSGTWRLSNVANTYAGTTSISGGVLEVVKLANANSASSIGTGSIGPLSITGGTLRYIGSGDSTNRTVQINNLGATIDASGSGAVNFTRTTATTHPTSNQTVSITLTGTNTGLNTWAANDANNGTGAVSYTKSGVGTWVMTGTNTYTGATTVTGGILALSGTGSINNSALTINGAIANFRNNSSVNYTGALAFTQGKISGTNWNGSLSGLTIGTGQTISPGNSPGTAVTGSQTWAGGGTYEFEVNNFTGTAGSDPGWDLISTTGNLSITANDSSPFTIRLVSLGLDNLAGQAANFTSTGNYSLKLTSVAGTLSGFAANAFTVDTSAFANDINNGIWSVTSDTHDLFLNFTAAAVPEPSSYAALAAALALSAAVMGRRRQAS